MAAWLILGHGSEPLERNHDLRGSLHLSLSASLAAEVMLPSQMRGRVLEMEDRERLMDASQPCL